jgi:micrococcal nuclease
MYQYAAHILRVVDGDTAEARVDLGFRVSVHVTLRLYGINTPEVKGTTKEAGLKSKARLKELIEGKEVHLESKALDKYGRTVAVIRLGDQNINEMLVKEGFAVVFMAN